MTDSNPPISAKGASWKTIAAVGSVLVSLACSVGTYLYTHAEEEAEAHARHREVITRLERIEEELSELGPRVARHDTAIAVQSARIASAERAIGKLERAR